MPSKVFWGYLKASAEGQTFYSHYVLTESQRSPASDHWSFGSKALARQASDLAISLSLVHTSSCSSLGTHNATPAAAKYSLLGRAGKPFAL